MSSTPSTSAGTTRSATVGRCLIVIGGALAALSSWLNWGAKTRELGAARTAYTIPAKFVIDSGVKVPGGGLSLGVVVLVLGLVVVAVGVAPPPWGEIARPVVGAAGVVTRLPFGYPGGQNGPHPHPRQSGPGLLSNRPDPGR